MRIEMPGGGHMTISDESPESIKIREGFDYEFIDNELVVKETKSGNTKWTKINKAKTATLQELRELVADLLKQ